MNYGKVNGTIYCRYANTAPIINSSLANEYGVEALLGSLTKCGFLLEEGRNVKLRFILDNRKLRMTCHARIDWTRQDEAEDRIKVGFSHLSLTDAEFRILTSYFVEGQDIPLVFTESVRQSDFEATPVIRDEESKEIVRDKAIRMPVELIEAIDERRGDKSFSEFVVKALKTYLKICVW